MKQSIKNILLLVRVNQKKINEDIVEIKENIFNENISGKLIGEKGKKSTNAFH